MSLWQPWMGSTALRIRSANPELYPQHRATDSVKTACIARVTPQLYGSQAIFLSRTWSDIANIVEMMDFGSAGGPCARADHRHHLRGCANNTTTHAHDLSGE